MSKLEALPAMREEEWRGHNGATPLTGNANFSWVQHFINHLAPQGTAGFVPANRSMSSNQSGEGNIRRALITLSDGHATQSLRTSSHGRN